MARLAPLAIASLVLCLAGAARAAAPRVAVLPVEFEGRVPEMSKVGLSQRLVEGMAQAGFEVSTGAALKNVLPRETCADAACYKQVAANLALDYLAVAHIRIREKSYVLRLQLVRGSTGEPAAPEEKETCELCGIQEVGEKLDRLARSLMAKVGAGRVGAARLTVHSDPPGASVVVDGRTAGETPLSFEVGAGAHEVALSAPGHASAQKKITLEPGVRGLVSVSLLPITSNPDGLIKAVGVRRNLGLATMAVGAASIGAGALVLALADRQRVACPQEADGRNCYRNAKLPAGMLIGGGAVAMTAGGLILFVDWSPRAPAPGAQARQWMVSAGRTF
jgi:hypothetical protein